MGVPMNQEKKKIEQLTDQQLLERGQNFEHWLSQQLSFFSERQKEIPLYQLLFNMKNYRKLQELLLKLTFLLETQQRLNQVYSGEDQQNLVSYHFFTSMMANKELLVSSYGSEIQLEMLCRQQKDELAIPTKQKNYSFRSLKDK